MLDLSQDVFMLGIPAVSLVTAGATIAWAALEVMASKKFASACQHNAQVDRHAIEMALKEFNRVATKLNSDVEDVKSTTKIHSKSIGGASVGAIKLGERVDNLESRFIKLTGDVEVIHGRLGAFGLNETIARITRLENAVNSSFRDLTNDIGHIRTWLGGMNTRQNEFESRFKDGTDSTETVKLALSELDNRICRMNGDVSGELEAIRADVGKHGNEIAKLHDMVAEVDKGDRAVLSLSASLRHHEMMIDGLDRRTEGLRQAIAVTAEQVEALHRKLDVPGLEQSGEANDKVGEISGEIEALMLVVAKNKSRIEDMDESIEDIYGRIGETASQIESVLVRFKELNIKVDGLDGILEVLPSGLASRLHAIESKVSTLDDISARVVPGCERRIEEIRADLQGQLDSVAADIVGLRS